MIRAVGRFWGLRRPQLRWILGAIYGFEDYLRLT